MAEPFLAEIRIMSFNFAPKGWAMCNGQQLPINQNQALFSLLGTTYGGNGQTTFALPDLRSNVPIHFGQGFTLGQKGGEQAHTLKTQEMASHIHFVNVSTASTGGVALAANNFLGSANNMYHAPPGNTTLNPLTITNAGGSQPHDNMMPYLTLTFCIAMQGIFPPRP